MKTEILKSYAKINLFLDIVGKREDNYHLIESLFHTIDLHDEIIIKENVRHSTTTIKTSGDFCLDDNSEENIVSKVFKYFEHYYNLEKSYSVEIVKNIPTGAGLGGGSSNAAIVIKYLNTKIEKPLNRKELLHLSTRFGADVPFFIDSGCKWASGIGDILTNHKKLPYYILLIYPDIHISTKEAYSRFNSSMFDKGSFLNFKQIIENGSVDFLEFKESLYNVFEENIYSFNSDIKNIKENITNLLNEKVVMSGSGSSLFVVYDNRTKMLHDYTAIKNKMKELKFVYALNLI